RQAAPESASQLNSQPSSCCDTKSAAGAAIHRLRQLKQSIRLPAKPPPRRARNRTITSAGPSSLASRCVTCQVARAARTNRAQKPNSSKRSAFEIVADTDRPERLRPVGTARGNSSVLDPQPKHVIAALATTTSTTIGSRFKSRAAHGSRSRYQALEDRVFTALP